MGKITTAATILLLVAATGVEAQNTFLCKIPANYVGSTEMGPIGQNPGKFRWVLCFVVVWLMLFWVLLLLMTWLTLFPSLFLSFQLELAIYGLANITMAYLTSKISLKHTTALEKVLKW